MKERNITITLEKAQEWYNSGNDSLKEIALQAFNESELKFDFRSIKSLVGERLKAATKHFVNVHKPDGIYFILSPNNIIHEFLATDEDKHNSIAVGIKMGDRFANVVLHDAAGGKKVALCQEDKVPCGSEQLFLDTFWKAISDWNGETNTDDMHSALNPDINLGENEYIPSVAQLHLILLNINEINKALIEAGGKPLKDDWYWSSTENSKSYVWYVCFNHGGTGNGNSEVSIINVRPSVKCEI